MNTIYLWIIICIISILTFLLGYRVGSSDRNEKYDGNFVINETDPEKDVISIQLSHDILDIFDQQTVHFKVVHENNQMSSKNR